MKTKDTICKECLQKYGEEVKVLVRKGVLRVVEPPCDFCEE